MYKKSFGPSYGFFSKELGGLVFSEKYKSFGWVDFFWKVQEIFG